MKKYKLVFLAAAFILLCSCTARAQNSPSAETLSKAFTEAGLSLLRERAAARDFSLSTPEGVSLSLSALKGKVVFLNFWATWCGPCRAEMPSMEALYGRYRDKGLEILAVNCGEGRAEVLSFMNGNKLSFPAVLDTNGWVNMSYGIQAIPTSFLIDRDGMIVARVVGSIDWDTPKIHTALETLLQ